MKDYLFETIDKTKIFSFESKVNNPKGNIIYVHGYGEHSSRYIQLVKFFNQAGFNYYSFDFRGHGRSSGKRGVVKNFSDYYNDLSGFFSFIQNKIGDTPVYIIAHSMGGCILSNFLNEVKLDFKFNGLIFINPYVYFSFKSNFIIDSFAKLVSKIMPDLTFNANLSSKEVLNSDRFLHDKLNAAVFLGIQEYTQKSLQIDKKISDKTLVISSKQDKIGNHIKIEEFARNIKADIITLEEQIHNIAFKKPEEISKIILDWIKTSK